MSSNNHNNKQTVGSSLVAGLGLAFIPALGLTLSLTLGLTSSLFSNNVSATTSTSGQVQLNAEVATAIAMKIASPNDTNPDCTAQSGITYGVANRYATSNGAEGSKQVDTFDGTTGGADEINTNTSCATLTMTPNTFDSTYSDVTVYTNSPNGYAVSLQAAEPNLVNTTDSTQYIPADTLTESNNTVSGGQNKWAYKTNNGIVTNWTAATTTDATIKSYDQETSGGDTTRVTYGISAGNNPTGKYATTLTYTATMFDGNNPYVSKLTVNTGDNITASESSLSIPFGKSATITVTPETGYYLSEVNCSNGIECSSYETGPEQTSAQTVTVTNRNTSNTGTISFVAAASDPWVSAGCDSATKDSPCTVNGVQYIKLADGNYWTKSSQGTTTWTNLNSVSCPAGTSKPSAATFQTLIKAYGGVDYPDFGSPYGTRDNDADVYNATGWAGGLWSTTEYSDSLAWNLYVVSGPSNFSANLDISNYKSYSRQVVCYRSSNDKMQNFSAAAHSSDAIGTTYNLSDSRDGQNYVATKLADNKIWMTQDLKLDGGRTLTSADSDVSSNFNLLADNSGTWCEENSAACDNQSLMTKQNFYTGYFYNWYAATASTGTYEIASGEVEASICPKGWHLPANNDFVVLDQAYGGSGSDRSDATQRDKFMAPPLSFNYTSLRRGGATGIDSGGIYWSRTAYDNSNSRAFNFANNNAFYPQNILNKWYGFAIRCIAN